MGKSILIGISDIGLHPSVIKKMTLNKSKNILSSCCLYFNLKIECEIYCNIKVYLKTLMLGGIKCD